MTFLRRQIFRFCTALWRRFTLLPTVAVSACITWTEFLATIIIDRPEIWCTFFRAYVCWRTFEAVNYIETTVKWELRAVANSDSE